MPVLTPIPEYADFQVDVRTFSESTQQLAKSVVERVIRNECEVSGSPIDPRIVTTVSSSAIDNDDVATRPFTGMLELYYGSESPKVIQVMPPDIVADDFVLLSLPPSGNPIPYVYWNIGVTDTEIWGKANREGKLGDLPPTYLQPYLCAGNSAYAADWNRSIDFACLDLP